LDQVGVTLGGAQGAYITLKTHLHNVDGVGKSGFFIGNEDLLPEANKLWEVTNIEFVRVEVCIEGVHILVYKLWMLSMEEREHWVLLSRWHVL